jgi:hypothetical protein
LPTLKHLLATPSNPTGGLVMSHHKYRALQRECHIQAAITADGKTKEELEKMEREYKIIADRLEACWQVPHQNASSIRKT